VHAHQDHLEQLLELLPSDQITYLHLFGDGRDLEPRSMGEILNTFMIKIAQRPNIRIASIGGRYYGMDRDKNWTRVERGYRAIASGSNLTSETPAEFIQNSYAHDLTDEFLEPTSFGSYAGMKEEDVVFFLNFRADRARQITKAFTDASFKEFPLSHPRSIQFVTMTSYYDEYSGKTFLTNELFSNTIGDIIAKQ
jgi:2,3-bisphosphoglycerate-independent phosphoglycerate mutase